MTQRHSIEIWRTSRRKRQTWERKAKRNQIKFMAMTRFSLRSEFLGLLTLKATAQEYKIVRKRWCWKSILPSSQTALHMNLLCAFIYTNLTGLLRKLISRPADMFMTGEGPFKALGIKYNCPHYVVQPLSWLRHSQLMEEAAKLEYRDTRPPSLDFLAGKAWADIGQSRPQEPTGNKRLKEDPL